MATPMNTPSTGATWELSADDLLAPLPEAAPRLGGAGPFVINLSTSSTEMSTQAVNIAGCQYAHVYELQRTEDRRVRFRLRIGPFATEDEVDAILEKVRAVYPSALSATADADDLRVIAALQAKAQAQAKKHPVRRTPEQPTAVTAIATAAAPARAPEPSTGPAASAASAAASAALAAASAAASAASAASAAASVAATAGSPGPAIAPSSAVPELELALELVLAPTPSATAATEASATAASPAPARARTAAPAAVPRAAAPAAAPRAAAPAAAPRAAPPAVAAPAVAVPPRTATRAAEPPARHGPSADAAQADRVLTQLELCEEEGMGWFVIQLLVGETALDVDKVPKHDIFKAYRLYSIAGLEQGRVMHALRLGFFKEEGAAQAVASYLAAFYERPSVKRVGVAERDRFADRRVDPRRNAGSGAPPVIEITNERYVRQKAR